MSVGVSKENSRDTDTKETVTSSAGSEKLQAYRPVSDLRFVSKLDERVVVMQLMTASHVPFARAPLSIQTTSFD